MLATAQSMKRDGATATSVTRAMRVDWRVGAPAATEILRTSGFSADEATGALRTEYRMSGLDLYNALKSAGYPSRAVAEALDRNGVRVDLNCIDAEGYPAPCGAFGGNAAQPVMGQLTWTPIEQGIVNGTLTITGTNIPQVEVRIGDAVLTLTSASPTASSRGCPPRRVPAR